MGLSDTHQQAARTILIRLSAPGARAVDVARRVVTTELVLAGDADGEAALATLIQARLVMVDSGTAEIAHEAVFREWPRLRGWIEEERDAFRMLVQLRAGAGSGASSTTTPLCTAAPGSRRWLTHSTPSKALGRQRSRSMGPPGRSSPRA